LWKQNFQAYFDDAKDSSQESRFKQVSRIKESFNEESRFKRRLKICKNLKKSIKISIKRIFQRKDWIAQFVQKNFSKKNLLPEFLLSGNRLPEGRNRLPEAQNNFIIVLQSSNRLPWTFNWLPMFLNVEFQISRVTTCDKTFSNMRNRLHNICNRLPVFSKCWFSNLNMKSHNCWCVIDYTIMVIDY